MSNEQDDPKSNKNMGMWVAIGVAIGTEQMKKESIND